MPESRAISFDEGISRKDLKIIRQRFQRLHRERLRRILGELRPTQQDLLQLLPLLFHINHPVLPGYINSKVPAGIPDFSPSRKALEAAHHLNRSFDYKKRAHRVFHILGLYLMGSIGTIGQSSGSDFDLWLCHAPSLSEKQRQNLQKKINAIEREADALGIELHIFLVDPERFRRREATKLDAESSGSTQHSLLLEEFYRSAVMLAGLPPLWWLVPPDKEQDYQRYTENLLAKRFVEPSDLLDLGGLDQVPAGEFFGAALWQLYKGIDSPYKSILKIFLMEAYSKHYPDTPWLALQTKRAIYAGETDLNQLDAYILMYRQVEEYLTQLQDQERLELARRCLYFKVDKPLSRLSTHHHWRTRELLKLTRKWGWSQTQLQMLDTRPEWKIDRVIRERNVMVSVLSRSYRLLTDFARTHAQTSTIDPMELNLLGRKLYTALDHRPGKIDSINPGISKNLTESELSLHHSPSKAGTLSWMLFRGKVEQADQQQPIKVTLNLVEMLLWCLLNQVWGSATLTHLFPSQGPIKRHELNAIFYDLQHLFPQRKSAHVTIDQLAGPAYPTLIALFVNLGQDPMQHLSAEGKQLTSDRYDPLSYGSARANLLINMEELVVTSWGERLVLHREGPEGLLDSLCQLLTMQQQPSQMPALAHIEAFSHAASKGPQVAQRLAGLYRHILGYFNQQPGHGGRYAFRISEAFYLIQQKEQGFQWRNLDSFERFLQALETPQHVFQPLQIDPRILRQTPYPALYRHNKPDLIQLFFHVQRESVQIYLLDKQGALFRQSMLMDSPRFMMLQQRRFLNSLQQLRLMLPGGAGNLLAETEFYELKQAPSGDWSIERRRVPLNGPDDYMELTLVTDSLASDAMPVALVCGDREFSRLEYGEMIYSATAGFLQGLRAGNKRYPIYLTSLRISSMRQDEAPATVTLLKLKRAIEQKLNHALEELG